MGEFYNYVNLEICWLHLVLCLQVVTSVFVRNMRG